MYLFKSGSYVYLDCILPIFGSFMSPNVNVVFIESCTTGLVCAAVIPRHKKPISNI